MRKTEHKQIVKQIVKRKNSEMTENNEFWINEYVELGEKLSEALGLLDEAKKMTPKDLSEKIQLFVTTVYL